jgi:hypothetical protein
MMLFYIMVFLAAIGFISECADAVRYLREKSEATAKKQSIGVMIHIRGTSLQ